LGDEKMGFKIMMEELARERLTVGIKCSCDSRRTIENTVIYTTEERLLKFRLPLSKYPI
jgi:acyl-CoA dehydrogenase